MSTLRRRLSWLAAMTLTAQVVVIGAASTALCCLGMEATHAEDSMECCKNGSHPGQACPMKKKPVAPGTPVMKSCCDMDQQALAALFGFAGVPEVAHETLPAAGSRVARTMLTEQPVALVHPPDAPPPRA